MTHAFRWLVVAVVTGLSLNSCTITKRQYTGGYHVEWKKNYLTQDNTQNQETLVSESSLDSTNIQVENQFDRKTEMILSTKSKDLASYFHGADFAQLMQDSKEKGEVLKTNLQKKVNTSRTAFRSKIENFKGQKRKVDFGEPMLRTPEEYLMGALWALLIGAVLVGVSVLFIVVVEVEGLSIGGLFVFLILVLGFACIVAVPILLLLALFSYLVG
jgi:hypothetical protein